MLGYGMLYMYAVEIVAVVVVVLEIE